jgi:phosphonate transport system substrate-binding protein
MIRLCFILLALAFALVAPAGAADKPPPLRVAVVPYLTTSVLLKLFEPLRSHLEQEMQRPVELYTAPDIRSHVQRIVKPDFDAVITAAHMGRLAQLDGGYLPVAGFESPLKGIVTVHKDSNIREIKELKGRSIAINDRLVLVSIVTLRDLQNHGVKLSDMQVVPAVTQNSALLSVARGDVDAAVTAIFTLNQIPESQRQDIRTIYATGTLPNVMFLANKRLPGVERDTMRRALLGFGATPAGKSFFSTSGFNGIVPLTEAYMKTIDVYLPETRRILAEAP